MNVIDVSYVKSAAAASLDAAPLEPESAPDLTDNILRFRWRIDLVQKHATIPIHDLEMDIGAFPIANSFTCLSSLYLSACFVPVVQATWS
jgi:hypothetical protein